MRNLLSLYATVLATLTALTACTRPADKMYSGTIERDTLLGVPCCVYLPADYTQRVENKHEVFPVLYLQHGMYGSEDDWTVQGHLVHWMDSLSACGEIREMVVIMPDNFLGSVPQDKRKTIINAADITPDGEPFDTSAGSAHWRKLTREQERGYEMSGFWEARFRAFMEEAESRYNISTDPSRRAIAGLSMGGFHTMHISHYLHDEFGYIGLFSPVIFPPDSAEVYNHWQEEVRMMADRQPLYWMGMGRDDHLYNQLQDYRQWLEENHIEYTYYESAGGHTWDNWQDYLCRFIKKFK